MSRINERRVEILAKARARKAEIAHTAPSENTLRRRDQVKRVKGLLREFILDHGVEIKDAGRVTGYESTARLPRHLSRGMIDLEDLLALTEYFEDLDITTILRDVILGAPTRRRPAGRGRLPPTANGLRPPRSRKRRRSSAHPPSPRRRRTRRSWSSSPTPSPRRRRTANPRSTPTRA